MSNIIANRWFFPSFLAVSSLAFVFPVLCLSILFILERVPVVFLMSRCLCLCGSLRLSRVGGQAGPLDVGAAKRLRVCQLLVALIKKSKINLRGAMSLGLQVVFEVTKSQWETGSLREGGKT